MGFFLGFGGGSVCLLFWLGFFFLNEALCKSNGEDGTVHYGQHHHAFQCKAARLELQKRSSMI